MRKEKDIELCHQEDIDQLSTKDLFKQHFYICYLRGDGWKKGNHYVFCYPYLYLYAFHMFIIREIEKRGYSIDPLWKDACYRGIHHGYEISLMTYCDIDIPEHLYKEN